MTRRNSQKQYPIEDRQEWRRWVTPKLLRSQSIHRWFAFPHSFTGELVEALIDEWGLNAEDRILDPFVGAGTTLVAAQARGIAATGYDLSPLSVLCSKVKVANIDPDRATRFWSQLQRALTRRNWPDAKRKYPDLVRDALPGNLLGAFEYTSQRIADLDGGRTEKDFFRLALLATMPRFSRAEATGGWLKWVTKHTSVTGFRKALRDRVAAMLEDVRIRGDSKAQRCKVSKADARDLPIGRERSYSAVITSPPYPNRHDYTRVFGVELMFEFCGWEQARQIRYQSFHSHPEANPVRKSTRSYQPPARLLQAVGRLRRTEIDRRIPSMIEGYFLDMHLCLKEMRRVTQRHSPIALVLGNAQFAGIPIPVDELTAEIGEELGLRCVEIRVVRFRGNSAQQMAEFGRRESRESVVIFERT